MWKLKADNFQNFWDNQNNLFKLWKIRTFLETEYLHTFKSFLLNNLSQTNFHSLRRLWLWLDTSGYVWFEVTEQKKHLLFLFDNNRQKTLI